MFTDNKITLAFLKLFVTIELSAHNRKEIFRCNMRKIKVKKLPSTLHYIKIKVKK